MRHIRMFLGLVFLGGMAPGCSGPASQSTHAGDFTVSVSIAPDPPVAAENEIVLGLADPAGKPVDGATLSFKYNMPAMGSMAEMTGSGQVTPLGKGRYRISYSLPLDGDWRSTVVISTAGHPAAELLLKVSPPHRGFAIEGSEREGTQPQAAAATVNGALQGKVMALGLEREQRIGVVFGTVERRPLTLQLHAPGRVDVDERRLADVTLKYEAYVEKLLVGETGKSVAAGTPLLELYSADLLAAEQELSQARHAAQTSSPGSAEVLQAARNRLQQWGLTAGQIDAAAGKEHADGRITLASPVAGVVLEKTAVEGMHVMPGMTLYRIGNLGKVWVVADFHELDAPRLEVGQAATMSIPAFGDAAVDGRVTFLAPVLDEKTRTLGARLEFANAALHLKPGMFAEVAIQVPAGNLLSVPDRALLLSGEHRYAFVDRGNGHLQAVEVQTGLHAGDFDEVRSGLNAGDRVAIDATFLLGSEAQLRGALPDWGAR